MLGLSLPARGAWIEIIAAIICPIFAKKSLPARGAWIEIDISDKLRRKIKSLPARGAWIEIYKLVVSNNSGKVAPRTGSVD